MPIYTKKGDRGKTSLFSSTGKKRRVTKDAAIVEALGALDELNSFLGIARSFNERSQRDVFLQGIQNNLFTICSVLAGAKLPFAEAETEKLEKEIDKIDSKVPKIANFVFSQGSPLATHLTYARALSRRAERRVVALSKQKKVPPQILKYLNRLSDMLFMLFRQVNFETKIKETTWKGSD
jgi:cob(I)alamin adenosyltransferase